jgi:hypothetical protein
MSQGDRRRKRQSMIPKNGHRHGVQRELRQCRLSRPSRRLRFAVRAITMAAATRAKVRTMSEQLTAETFQPHVEKIFRVKGGRHALKLCRVDIPTPTPGVPRQSFNLIFSGPPGDVLREGLYTLEVENGPPFDLYVMPIHTPQLGRQDYQAAFN